MVPHSFFKIHGSLQLFLNTWFPTAFFKFMVPYSFFLNSWFPTAFFKFMVPYSFFKFMVPHSFFKYMVPYVFFCQILNYNEWTLFQSRAKYLKRFLLSLKSHPMWVTRIAIPVCFLILLNCYLNLNRFLPVQIIFSPSFKVCIKLNLHFDRWIKKLYVVLKALWVTLYVSRRA